jgi:hypothetical protein
MFLGLINYLFFFFGGGGGFSIVGTLFLIFILPLVEFFGVPLGCDLEI